MGAKLVLIRNRSNKTYWNIHTQDNCSVFLFFVQDYFLHICQRVSLNDFNFILTKEKVSESKEKTDVDTELPAVTNSPPEKMKIDNSG